MAPKRRVVKTVRKSTPKSKTPASKSKTPAAKSPVSEASPLSSAAAETPASQSTTFATPPPADSATTSPGVAETPVTKPVTTPEPASTETPASEPAAAVEATPGASVPPAAETPGAEPAVLPENVTMEAFESEATPEASGPAAAETPAEEPAVAQENVTVEASEPAKPTRKTTRVVKVVKKKIIKKKVPKASPAVKDGEKAQEAGDLPVAVAEGPPAEQPEPENPNVAASEDPVRQEDSMEMENLGSREENKDLPVEQDGGEGVEAATAGAPRDEEAGISERQRRRKTEIFIGGLDRDAKEEDIRKVFGKVGEIVEVRMMMDGQTGKNKGYCFLRYREAAQAKKAVAEFAKVEICGKLCGAAALEGNDTIFLGNIDKKWKKEDVIKLLQEIGVEKIDTVTVMADPNNADANRGFAFLELETNRDAQIAYKKLQKKDAFGKGRNIKVAWAEPLNDPDEEEMQKVKSVYVESIPLSWNEDKVRESFKKFGEIERIVLARNIPSAKRKDFAFVNYTMREAAVTCIESFDKEEIIESGSKVHVDLLNDNTLYLFLIDFSGHFVFCLPR
ncbi:putative RNA-binding protein 47 [Cocos nucifera]|uniref:Putative RNA-binding protein 47 n=1 Tax=Cocos nucifera TaxID=13894 RepID=A0A8K0IW59_COCNU|nr:putative RNA-binding protein 47 [Cocos nucifera]